MGKVQSVYKAIEKVKVKDQYCACISHFIEIKKQAGGYYEALYDSFRFGYLQGMKAAKAEMNRGGGYKRWQQIQISVALI